MLDDLTPYINDFAKRSFRDLADQDYIAARATYRGELDYQFLWCGLQAIEKYLKGILLFNHQSSKGLRHNLVKAVEQVAKINDIEFSLPDDVDEFIKYLNEYGADRYFVRPSYLREDALLQLDKAIWHIRRYCFYMRGETKNKDGTIKQLLPINVAKTNDVYFKNYPNKYQIPNGFLEKVLEKNNIASRYLTWKNFYFGRNKKKKIKNFPLRMTAANPTYIIKPDILEEIRKLVDIPKT